ncbi:MAG: helix-turn-helix domain-containing protein [Pseudonocardia sp.]
MHVLLAAKSVPGEILGTLDRIHCVFGLAELAEPVDGSIGRRDHDVLLVVADDPAELILAAEAARSASVEWVVWNRRDLVSIASDSYRLGAAAVLPGHIAPEVLERVLRAAGDGSRADGAASAGRVERFLRSEQISRANDPESVILVRSGAVATIALHRDGHESILAISGAGEMVCAGTTSVLVRSHSNCEVVHIPWTVALTDPHVAAGLRRHVTSQARWASARSHVDLGCRVTAILQALAASFGIERADLGGTLIDLDLTHGELAAAAGATRATVSRRIGAMRRRGRLRTVTVAGRRRFLLPVQPPQAQAR